MYHRIKEIRSALHLTQAEFAQRIGLSQTSLAMIEVGKRTFSNKHIKLICSEFNVNENWLRNGEGDMFHTNQYAGELYHILQQLTPDTQEFLLLTAKNLLLMQNKMLQTANLQKT